MDKEVKAKKKASRTAAAKRKYRAAKEAEKRKAAEAHKLEAREAREKALAEETARDKELGADDDDHVPLQQ